MRTTLFYVGLVSPFLLNAAQGQVKYTLRELRGSQSNYTYPIAINNGGEVVGTYRWNNYTTHSFIYQGGALHDLGTGSGYNNNVTAINNYGQVVGYFDSAGYLRKSNGTVTLLGPSGGLYLGTPYSINDSGAVVGASGNSAAFYQNGQISVLGNFNGRNLYQAQKINNRGQILALYEAANATIGTIIYSGGQMQGIVPPSGIRGDIVGEVINDHGIVLGSYGLSPGAPDTGYFIFTNGTFQDLGTYSHLLLAMNNGGQIVGAGAASYPSVAILSDGIGDQDLNKLIDPTAGVTLREATGINDSGQICGWGYDAAGNLVGFLLTPIK